MRGRPTAPSRRARSRSWRRADLVALDFETTGLDLRRDAVVSFGLVPVNDGRVDLSGALYREVAPVVDPTISSIRVHQLRPQDLAARPRLEQVVELLRDGLANRFLLTWAAGVETAFLGRTFGGGNLRWRSRTIDVRSLVVGLDRLAAEKGDRPRGQTYSLEATAARFGIPVEQSHHALDDAFMTAELFLVVAALYESHGRDSIRSFLRITNSSSRATPFL